MAEVSQKTDVARAAVKDKTDRITSVVRNRKSIDRDVAHVEGHASRENAAIEPGLKLTFDRFAGQAVAIDRNLQFGAQRGKTLAVVAVLMRDQSQCLPRRGARRPTGI